MNFDEFEREGKFAYYAFANAVADILEAAIDAEGGYRLQQIQRRAKSSVSLRKKLEMREIAMTEQLETNIKDLAGCRVVFYTNSDVTRLIQSGVIHENFEVIEVKLHHPRRDDAEASEFYISNHYLVTLRQERIALPEYAKFAGLRCEIQIQTILNHAWAEMAHDTIYKVPVLDNFGSRAFQGIQNRLQKVAQKYLLPAGYEFQKIASDFKRLVDGKALFDGDALEAIVGAVDNNVRGDALEAFAEHVLPFYDDLPGIYPHVTERLIEAATRARASEPVEIETPYGALPAKTFGNILKAITDILMHYRYVDVEETFNAFCSLYGLARSDDERKHLNELGKSIAEHQMHVWREHGPAVQNLLIDCIKTFSDEKCRELEDGLIPILGEILGSEIRGTTNSSSAITIHRGSVVASDALTAAREGAIDLLKKIYRFTTSQETLSQILIQLENATRSPHSGMYSNALAKIIMANTLTTIEFQTAILPGLSLRLKQAIEDRVHRHYWRYVDLPESMREDLELVTLRTQILAAAITFRDAANTDTDFLIYKVLIGYNSVYPPAWDDKDFFYAEAEEYRTAEIEALLDTVSEATADLWFDRLSRYAETDSDDAATFPTFGRFLERLGETKPDILLSYIDRFAKPFANFLPGMLTGLVRSEKQAEALRRINHWIDHGEHLNDIAWYLRFSVPFDEAMLLRVFNKTITNGDSHVMRNVLIAGVQQYGTQPGTIISNIFLPALNYLAANADFSWVRMPWFSWLGNTLVKDLDEDQANQVLRILIRYPELEGSAEYIAAAIAEKWPAAVVSFIEARLAFARTQAAPPHYVAVPFSIYQLQAPLSKNVDIVLSGARRWYDIDSAGFEYETGKLIASIFPELSNGLGDRLIGMIERGTERDMTFVLSILAAFDGKAFVFDLVRRVVARLPAASQSLAKARQTLRETSVVSGEFGFAELYAARQILLEGWLADESALVRDFANEHIIELKAQVAAESRSAEASIALRKLEYGEGLDDPEPED
ncbi:hypothetical protein PMI16_04838 [Herbaspirillum sp. CF444]|uniref:RelA/SpoT domain-containing protein n=1 Tax=Herbaspirillum sp. CF444 TaxID=1144319 RepID=UPI00027246A2|nr:RelA/SpoT domain-containing protein [Herbaspirillum sp. CF444]EJL81232.1 hypothetical protein PMI16_04838 [Herbaspirillum sp. CF444]